MKFEQVLEDIFLYKDVINVYVLRHYNKAILIDFGSGNVLDNLSELGIEQVDYILHTHYHRDQCFGDKRAIEIKIKIAAPKKERKLFENAEDFWKIKSYYDLYYFKPTFFVSTYNIPLDLYLKHGDAFTWNDYELKIIKTSGHTSESISYILEKDNKCIAFTGDLIHSGGKVLTYYDLEYIYNDNGEGGIKRSLSSFKRLLTHDPVMLLPSHGEVIKDPRGEISILKKKFAQARKVFCSQFSGIDVELPELKERELKSVNLKEDFPHLLHYEDRPPFIIKGKNENCIMIDFAGDTSLGYTLPEIKKIFKEEGIKTIDFIIPTHYHDDHTGGITLLSNEFNAPIYAFENMVDVLENPTHYRLGCLIDRPIRVDHILKDKEIFRWDDFEFQFFHFPGQTEYHMGLLTKIDGKQIFFTGDTITQRSFVDRDTNLNGLNLCKLGKDVGFMKCADILLRINPDYLAISHYGVIRCTKEMLLNFKKFVSEYEPTIAGIVAQDIPNFGLDPNWICFNPIRIILTNQTDFLTYLQISNYLDKDSELHYELNLPPRWKAKPISGHIKIERNSVAKIPFSFHLPKDESSKRTVITANIKWNGKGLGPFPDLMIDKNFTPSDAWRGWHPGRSEDQMFWIIKSIISSKKFFK
jgi:glyoxylase-like metal-dependent hydrolase (beta-lactamase superfamily II)